MKIRKVEAYETEDGVRHGSLAAAEYHVTCSAVYRLLESAWCHDMDISSAMEALNANRAARKIVRDWLHAADRLYETEPSPG